MFACLFLVFFVAVLSPHWCHRNHFELVPTKNWLTVAFVSFDRAVWKGHRCRGRRSNVQCPQCECGHQAGNEMSKRNRGESVDWPHLVHILFDGWSRLAAESMKRYWTWFSNWATSFSFFSKRADRSALDFQVDSQVSRSIESGRPKSDRSTSSTLSGGGDSKKRKKKPRFKSNKKHLFN